MRFLIAIFAIMGILFSAGVSWNLQPQYFSHTAYLDLDIDCAGNATCALGITGALECNVSQKYANDTQVFVYSGARPGMVVLSFPDDGFYRISADCVSGLESAAITGNANAHSEGWWETVFYILVFCLPIILMLAGLYVITQGGNSTAFAFASMAAFVFKYMVALLTLWTPMFELSQFDFIVVFIAVFLLFLEMYKWLALGKVRRNER